MIGCYDAAEVFRNFLANKPVDPAPETPDEPDPASVVEPEPSRQKAKRGPKVIKDIPEGFQAREDLSV